MGPTSVVTTVSFRDDRAGVESAARLEQTPEISSASEESEVGSHVPGAGGRCPV